jgi:hypothetical protein
MTSVFTSFADHVTSSRRTRLSQTLSSLGHGIGVRRGVSKRVEDGRRPSALWAGYPRNCHNAVSGVAYLQGVEGSGKADPGKTLGSP